MITIDKETARVCTQLLAKYMNNLGDFMVEAEQEGDTQARQNAAFERLLTRRVMARLNAAIDGA